MQQKVYGNWLDKCSMHNAIYDANPTPSSHVSIALLEAIEFNDDTPDNLDGLEMRITDLTKPKLTYTSCEKYRELMRSAELEQENESLQKTIEEIGHTVEG
eukprot:3732916-Ditylum_brightwellii.AAC.1